MSNHRSNRQAKKKGVHVNVQVGPTTAKTGRAKQVGRAVRPLRRGKDCDPLLFDLLSHGTPHGSEGITAALIARVCKQAKRVFSVDGAGNLHVRVSNPSKKAVTTMFSSHMDTVHRDAGKLNLFVTTGPTDQEKDFVYAYRDKRESILGADDKIGVYIMLKMITQSIPGLYVFHVGEECGCVGSRWLAENPANKLKNIKRCIAFDRMNYGDVIKEQAPGIGCSTEFVTALAKQLNELQAKRAGSSMLTGPKYTWSSARGTVTDSIQYRKLIPECTNLSVGYFRQHTSMECVDLFWLTNILLPIFLEVKWDTLPTKRDPTVEPTRTSAWRGTGYGARSYGHGEKWVNGRWVPADYKDGDAIYLGLPQYMKNYSDIHLRDYAWDPDRELWDLKLSLRKWTHLEEEERVRQLVEVLEYVHKLETRNSDYQDFIEDSEAGIEWEKEETEGNPDDGLDDLPFDVPTDAEVKAADNYATRQALVEKQKAGIRQESAKANDNSVVARVGKAVATVAAAVTHSKPKLLAPPDSLKMPKSIINNRQKALSVKAYERIVKAINYDPHTGIAMYTPPKGEPEGILIFSKRQHQLTKRHLPKMSPGTVLYFMSSNNYYPFYIIPNNLPESNP